MAGEGVECIYSENFFKEKPLKIGDLDLYFQKKSSKNKTLDVDNGFGDGGRRFGRSGFGGVVGAGVGNCKGQRSNCWGDVIVLQFEA